MAKPCLRRSEAGEPEAPATTPPSPQTSRFRRRERVSPDGPVRHTLERDRDQKLALTAGSITAAALWAAPTIRLFAARPLLRGRHRREESADRRFRSRVHRERAIELLLVGPRRA